ncbi:hypothetical protein T484DRAFT_1619064, partial [Baffinella frigidus]
SPYPETRNPKPETRNPTLETRNPKPETRNPKPETRNPKPETRNPKPETRGVGPAAPRGSVHGTEPPTTCIRPHSILRNGFREIIVTSIALNESVEESSVRENRARSGTTHSKSPGPESDFDFRYKSSKLPGCSRPAGERQVGAV